MTKLTWLTLALILFVAPASFAQKEGSKSYISKGQWMLGGTASFSILHDFKNPTLNVSAYGSYFVGKRLAVGLDLSYLFFHYSQPDNVQSVENNTTKHSFLVTPITRFYLGVKRFAPFIEVGYGWNIYDTKSSNGNNSIDAAFNRGYYKAGIGFNHFISQSFAIEGLFCYLMASEQNTSYDDDGLSIRLGLQYYFNKNQKGVTEEGSTTFLERGYWMLGGVVNTTTIESTDNKLSPEVGYFLKDNFALGVRVMNRNSTYYDSFTFGPFARYYMTTKRFAPFIDGFIGWGSGESGDLFQAPQKVITVQAATGFNYFINDFVALESQLSYGLAGFDKPLLNIDAGLKFFIVRKD